MTQVEHADDGLRIRDACPARIDVLMSAADGDGRSFVLSASGAGVRWWDVEAGPDHGLLFDQQLRFAPVEALALARTADGGGIVLARGGCHDLWRWDLASGKPVGGPARDWWQPGWRTGPMAAVETDDGPVAVTGGRDGCLQRWDPVGGVRLGEPWAAHRGGVWSLAAAELPGSRRVVVSGGADGVVRCWDPRTGAGYGPLIRECGLAVAIVPARLPDGRVIVCVASGRGKIHRRDILTGEPVAPAIVTGWEPRPWAPLCRGQIAYLHLPGGGVIASCVDGHTVYLLDLITGQPVTGPVRVEAAIITAMAAAWRPDGTPLVVVGDGDGNVRRFDARTGELAGAPVHPHGVPAGRVAAIPVRDGRIILAVAARHRVRCFDASSGDLVGDRLRPWHASGYGLAAAHLPDGRTVLVSTGEGGIARLDVLSGTALEPVPAQGPGLICDVASVQLPDGRVLIAGAGDDGRVYRWDATTGAPIGPPLAGHPASIQAVTTAHRPDGTAMIISGCEAGQVRRWDAVTGSAIGGPLPGNTDMITGLAVVSLPGGRQVLIATDFDGWLHHWDPFTGEIARPVIAIPQRAHLIAAHTDCAGSAIALLQADDDEPGYRTMRWALQAGAPAGDPLPVTVRALYDDSGQTMMVLSEPDGTITIQPLPQPPAQHPMIPFG